MMVRVVSLFTTDVSTRRVSARIVLLGIRSLVRIGTARDPRIHPVLYPLRNSSDALPK